MSGLSARPGHVFFTVVSESKAFSDGISINLWGRMSPSVQSYSRSPLLSTYHLYQAGGTDGWIWKMFVLPCVNLVVDPQNVQLP